jgi:2-haloacid dehalogenase
MSTPNVDALFFDVFGTVVDWRSGVIREGEELGDRHDLDVDWAAFADAWRTKYEPSMEQVRSGEQPWTKLDDLHRTSLNELLDESDVELPEGAIEDFTHVWHRLNPWPDTVPGLVKLREHYTIASLSNGNISLLTDMAKRARLPWDVILSAELAKRYKPDREVYQLAAELLSLDPSRTMMVAAHDTDLTNARDAGLHTAYVHRPLEWGPQPDDEIQKPAADEYDVVADDILDLAKKLA